MTDFKEASNVYFFRVEEHTGSRGGYLFHLPDEPESATKRIEKD